MEIKLENLSKNFDGVEILKDINITFEKGKIYGLIGRNGSGKSVLLKILCSFYEPSTGKVLYNGIDINKKNIFPPNTRALIEKPNFLPDLTGKENLLLLASIQNIISENEIEEALKNVGLADEMNKKYHKYSIGMKQKLGIAQVIMENPAVLILDEPFNGLDESSATNIRNLLLEERKNGKIIILATHIKEDIEKLCDYVYKIDNGTLIKYDNKK